MSVPTQTLRFYVHNVMKIGCGGVRSVTTRYITFESILLSFINAFKCQLRVARFCQKSNNKVECRNIALSIIIYHQVVYVSSSGGVRT